MTCRNRSFLAGSIFTLLLAATVVVVVSARSSPRSGPAKPGAPGSRLSGLHATVMISIDGFRPDLLTQGWKIPNLHKFQASALFAKGMIPAFPSKTFPNHYTLVTGLYPASHGIISNRMYDPLYDEWFSMGTVEDKWWEGGEPLWITAVLAELRSAVFFWPGSEQKLRGVRPTYWLPYDQERPFEDRIDKVIEWLTMPEDVRPHMIFTYFHEPDLAIHIHGPHSDEARVQVERIDELIGDLMRRIVDADLHDRVNVVLVADHGHTDVSPSRRVFLEECLDRKWLAKPTVVDWSPITALNPPPHMVAEFMANLTARCSDHVDWYLKKDVPAQFHYMGHRRIMPIVGVSHLGWEVMRTNRTGGSKGNHGYDPHHPDMHALFMAAGPSFRQGVIPTIDNVDLYPTLCKIHGIAASGHNGSLDTIRDHVNWDVPRDF